MIPVPQSVLDDYSEHGVAVYRRALAPEWIDRMLATYA